MGWTGSVLLVIGMLLVGRKNRNGFLWGLAGELLWTYKSYRDEQWDLLVICAIFCGVYIKNWWAWRPRKLRVA